MMCDLRIQIQIPQAGEAHRAAPWALPERSATTASRTNRQKWMRQRTAMYVLSYVRYAKAGSTKELG